MVVSTGDARIVRHHDSANENVWSPQTAVPNSSSTHDGEEEILFEMNYQINCKFWAQFLPSDVVELLEETVRGVFENDDGIINTRISVDSFDHCSVWSFFTCVKGALLVGYQPSDRQSRERFAEHYVQYVEEAIDDLQSHYRAFEVLLLSKPHPPLDRAIFAYMVQLIDDPDAHSHHGMNEAAAVVDDAVWDALYGRFPGLFYLSNKYEECGEGCLDVHSEVYTGVDYSQGAVTECIKVVLQKLDSKNSWFHVTFQNSYVPPVKSLMEPLNDKHTEPRPEMPFSPASSLQHYDEEWLSFEMEYKLESKVWYHPPAEADRLVTESISELLSEIISTTDDDTVIGSHHLMGGAIKYCSTASSWWKRVHCARRTLRVEIMPHDEEARKRCNEFFAQDVVDAFDQLQQEMADYFSIELVIAPRPPQDRVTYSCTIQLTSDDSKFQHDVYEGKFVVDEVVWNAIVAAGFNEDDMASAVDFDECDQGKECLEMAGVVYTGKDDSEQVALRLIKEALEGVPSGYPWLNVTFHDLSTVSAKEYLVNPVAKGKATELML